MIVNAIRAMSSIEGKDYMSQKSVTAKRVLFISLGALLVVAVYLLIAVIGLLNKGTPVSFQSSDGRWMDHEIPFKGYSFNMVVGGFVVYRYKCSADDVVLQRITPRPSRLSIEYWLNDYDELKWRVPLAETHPNLKGQDTSQIQELRHCEAPGMTDQEFNHVVSLRDAYLSELETRYPR